MQRGAGIDTVARSLVKTVSWRLIATVMTIVTMWAITRDWSISAGTGIALNASKAVAYYFHERLWNRIKFGRHDEQAGATIK